MMILAGIALTLVLGVFLNKVTGTTTLYNTTTTLYTGTYTEDQYYYYSDYQGLIEQIYEDIYDDIYAQIYAEVIGELADEYYDEIYALVEEELISLLSEDEFDLYVTDFQEQIYSVVDVAEHSVFGITNYNASDAVSIGSGVVYKYDSVNQLYYIITNYHVVRDGVRFEIYLPDESTVDATVLGYDTEVDIAVLTFSSVGLDNIVPAPLAADDKTVASDMVFAVGNPIGYNFYNSITMGIVSGLGRKVDNNRYIDYIQHDAAINGGNSGGPIFNIDGEVVGINVSKLANVEIEGMGFAIPIELVKRIITRIEDGTLTQNTIMPRIGCDYYMVDEIIDGSEVFLERVTVNGIYQYNLTIGLPNGVTNGLIVRDVDVPGTLHGYLESGDLIVRIHSYNITDETSFQDYLYANYEAGDFITLYYYEFDGVNHVYETELSMKTIQLK